MSTMAWMERIGVNQASQDSAEARNETVSQLQAVKHDKGKPDYSLLPLTEMEAIVKVLELGAKKYNRDNYKRGDGHSDARLIGACLRHISAYQSGEECDEESQESHIAHAACCLIFMLYNHAHDKPVRDLWLTSAK